MCHADIGAKKKKGADGFVFVCLYAHFSHCGSWFFGTCVCTIRCKQLPLSSLTDLWPQEGSHFSCFWGHLASLPMASADCVEPLLPLVRAWVGEDHHRADRLEAAKEALNAACQALVTRLTWPGFAVFCALATRAKFCSTVDTSDLIPESWMRGSAQTMSVVHYCLGLSKSRLSVWIGELHSTVGLLSEWLFDGLLTESTPGYDFIAALRAAVVDFVTLVRVAHSKPLPMVGASPRRGETTC